MAVFSSIAGWLPAIVLAANISLAMPAYAQETGKLPADLAPLAEEAVKKGMTVIVMSPNDSSQQDKAATEPSMTERGLMLRQRVRGVILNIPAIWNQMTDTLRRAGPNETMGWLWFPLAVAAGGLLAGTALAEWLRRAAGKRFEPLFEPDPQTRTQKIGYLLFRAGLAALYCVVIFATAIVVALVFERGHDPSRTTILAIVSAFVIYRVFSAVILSNITACDLPAYRMVSLDDKSAKSIQHDFQASLMVVIVSLALCWWMKSLGIDERAHSIMLVVASLIAAIIFAVLVVRHRKPISGALLGAGDPGSRSGLRSVLAGNWHFLALLYLVAAWVVSSYRIFMNLPSATILVAAPALALIAALPLYGIVLILIDRIYIARRKRFDQKVAWAVAQARADRQAEREARAEALAEEPAGQNSVEHIASDQDSAAQYAVFKPLFKPLLERAAGILITLLGVGYVLGTWGVTAGERGNPLMAFMDTILVVFLAWFAYRAVIISVDDRMKVEGVSYAGGDPTDLDEGLGGQGASRLGTLLPLIRIVSVTAILVIAGMIILSELNVNIAPLFAGAGVIGLAVGFGAQTLIRDMFSGGFFLFDDAFRKGEYVEMGQIQGTVEKISLRSFQLRHQNGPLHTIPFGEIQQLTNYSRDWVVMKLPLRVTYDTDVEKVRKLVKKLGQRLLEHPQVGKNFLQPLKSQGVIKMEDSAMIIRVKFMTKPGDQWVTRKVVYQEIRALFEQEGIRFANKEVTVRIAQDPAGELEKHQLHEAAAAAAARSVADDEAASLAPETEER